VERAWKARQSSQSLIFVNLGKRSWLQTLRLLQQAQQRQGFTGNSGIPEGSKAAAETPSSVF
jgi:hypothetical protein